MIDLTCQVSQSATIGIYLRVFVYTMVYSVPTWFVSLQATENVVMSATPTTQVRTTNLPWSEKCQTKQGNGRLSCRWPTVIFTPE